MTTAEKFEELAAETIEKAESIRCSFEEFVDGMRILQNRMAERNTQVEEEWRNMGRKGRK